MLGRFGRDTGSLLGVEITSDAIRMLHLRRQRGGCRVVGWAHERLGAASGSSLEFDQMERLVAGLRQAHARCRTSQCRAALALPASQVICKVCRLPAGLPGHAVEAALLAQAEQLFPFPVEDLALDFQVHDPCVEDVGQVEVLVVACRQSQLDPLERVFAQAGLQLVAVEVDSFALRRALVPEPQAGDMALLQLEPDEVILHRWQGGRVPHRQRIALPSLERWAEAVDGLWQPDIQGAFEQVVLFGAAADEARAADLSERLGVKCHVGRPGPLVSGFDETSVPAAAMALACGLAMGGPV
ncbi:pilus assembly protein PilM [Pseudomonas soli]|jgi:type IV pilus assembly protein PilM|uniref:type IV pilus biogenesis protein PilM n=1 Tax=Pseudomonas TaxID=286 RepID=UPI000CDBE5DA|nr:MULTISPECIES: pilus assembly protein PilM [Pseudomonas]AUY35291.1 pilus assembly protein PilM [Pseudomonas sp. PONIH3]MDT3713338.1 pilus assembly protein PilM [Pseudomonas soli]MDT3729601.1 pilus assembly protein PilM [Pseudomonas soli]NBK40637.1 pilus assembly protein PilM [Pseudomonas soli]WJO21614.1 pilus assembly protein PilM [Pseudomonas soli]